MQAQGEGGATVTLVRIDALVSGIRVIESRWDRSALALLGLGSPGVSVHAGRTTGGQGRQQTPLTLVHIDALVKCIRVIE